ncbi:MAG: hypothetical protein EXR35_07040 [Limnohabitans sp.]|nr:hypothetical protein [Limnohabitans sp.]
MKYLHHLDFVKLRQLSTMNISKPYIVSLTWLLKDTLGETLDKLDDPVEFLIGGHDLFDKIEQSLSGLMGSVAIRNFEESYLLPVAYFSYAKHYL